MKITSNKTRILISISLVGLLLFESNVLIHVISAEINKKPIQSFIQVTANMPQGIEKIFLKATWYAKGLSKPENLTCASRVYPKGTKLYLENIANSKKAWLSVNDFGPEERTGKDIDISLGGAKKLRFVRRGIATLKIIYVVKPNRSKEK